MTEKYVSRLIENEITNSIGCSNISSFAYMGAVLAKYSTGSLQRIELEMSSLVYKNTKNVIIPSSNEKGFELAVLVGYLLNNSHKNLEIFVDINEHILSAAKNMLQNISYVTHHKTSEKELFIKLTAHTETEKITIMIEDRYDRLTFVERNGGILFLRNELKEDDNSVLKATSVEDLIDFVLDCNTKEFSKLYEYSKTQWKQAQTVVTKNSNDDCILCGDLSFELHKYIFNSISTRMQGEIFPVYALTDSGSLGIGVFVSTEYLCEVFNADEQTREKAILLAFLLSVRYQFKTCVASAICGSAIATGFAVSGVTCLIKNQDKKTIAMAINHFIASFYGIICDGAKNSCAHKIAASAITALTSAQMSINGIEINDVNGINMPNVNDTILKISNLNDTIITKINQGVIESL